ncbi:DUF1801 domain-containing protein [Brevundimonas sp.]|uniref:DUF1801 domain-containing protein n=1 Tax=Brevundimonas sp. TaxID=1871086 RepID=UPI00286BD620|nr:DUF1801 domain-containing protein [Brevundimonas sp.]
MEKSVPAASPDAYVAGLTGWQHDRVAELRDAVRAAGPMEEVIKWGHLVYLSNGPVCLIRAEGKRVLFGLWRGQRLLDLEPKLKAGGQFEMASASLAEGEALGPASVSVLTRAAIELNATLGDPTKAAKRS